MLDMEIFTAININYFLKFNIAISADFLSIHVTFLKLKNTIQSHTDSSHSLKNTTRGINFVKNLSLKLDYENLIKYRGHVQINYYKSRLHTISQIKLTN